VVLLIIVITEVEEDGLTTEELRDESREETAATARLDGAEGRKVDGKTATEPY
jgi:hypothetical protein